MESMFSSVGYIICNRNDEFCELVLFSQSKTCSAIQYNIDSDESIHLSESNTYNFDT